MPSAVQENNPHNLLISKVHCHVHNSRALTPVLSQMHPTTRLFHLVAVRPILL